MKTFILVIMGQEISIEAMSSVAGKIAGTSEVISFKAADFLEAIGIAVMMREALGLRGNAIIFPAEFGHTLEELNG